MKELLYADDLGETKEELELRYKRRKKALHGKVLKINLKKTKMITFDGEKVASKSKVDPCTKCGKRACRSSIQCTRCKGWTHKQCSGSLKKEGQFVCLVCSGSIPKRPNEEDDSWVVMDGDKWGRWTISVTWET